MKPLMNMGMGYYGKEFAQRPACPFCGLPVEKPKELHTRRPGEMPVGSCSCGAVYSCDVTGRNQGAAFIEALVFGCNMDWDLAWNLFPEEDYLEKRVEYYDYESHMVVPVGSFEGRRIRGVLCFIRLARDIRELAGEGVQKQLERATVPVPNAPPAQQPPGKRIGKKELETLVKEYRLDQLLELAGQDKRILRELQRLLYSGDKLLRLRAAEILGKTCAVIARKDPGTVSDFLQKLLTAVSNPGSSSWGAIDAIGEIISNSPDLLIGYLPALFPLLEDNDFRNGALKAIGLTARVRPDLIRKTIFRLLPFLNHSNPETRGYSAWIFGSLDVPEAKAHLERLLDDNHQLQLYRDGQLENKTVGQIAADALEKIAKG